MPQTPHAPTTNRFDGSKTRIAIVQAGWHKDIVDEGCRACIQALTAHGVAANAIDIFDVPGSFEIPLLVKRLAAARDYDAVIAAGFVVDGGIYRHEFVADAVISALMTLQLDCDIPIFSMVLTPQQFHEHTDHIAFFKNHMKTKGAEAARACLATLAVHRQCLIDNAA